MKRSFYESLSICPLFKGLTDKELKSISEEFISTTITEKNEIIFSEDKYQRALVIILKGSVTVTKHSGDTEILMSILKKGDIFGMATLFYEEDNYLTQIKASEKVTMAVISKENVIKILSLYPEVNKNYIGILSEKIHFLNKKIR